MTEQNIAEETLQLVRDAQKPGVFNLSEVIKGRGYPTKEVSVYIDGEAAFQLVELEDRMQELSDAVKAGPEYEELEKAANELAERVQKSKLIFTMRGVNQGIVERITDKADELYGNDGDPMDRDDAWFRYYITSLVAANVVKVENADGEIDERVFEYEDMLDIRNNIPVEAWGVLVNTMQKLTLAGGYFKELTDAGFLPKS